MALWYLYKAYDYSFLHHIPDSDIKSIITSFLVLYANASTSSL